MAQFENNPVAKKSRPWRQFWAKTALGFQFAVVTLPGLPNQAYAEEPMVGVTEGRVLPGVRSNTIQMPLFKRNLFVLRDDSPEGNRPGNTETYYLESAVLLKTREGKDSPYPKWAQAVREEQNGTVRIRLQIVLQHRDLTDAAALFLRVNDAEYLKSRGRTKNGDKPLTVVVKPMPVSRVRLEFVDLSAAEPAPVAFGTMDVSRAGNERDLWVSLEPGTLERLAKLEQEELLGVRVVYAYSGVNMVHASIVNVANTDVRDYLTQWLKHRNLSDTDIYQSDIDDFSRHIHVVLGSQIRADHADAASYLVNNISSFTMQVFEPASKVQFAELPQADQMKLAERLGALLKTAEASKTSENVEEQTRSEASSRGVSVGAGVKVKGIGVNLGFTGSKEQIDMATKRTGVVMQYNDATQSWVPSLVQKYRARSAVVQMGLSYAAEVSVGVGKFEGMVDGGTSSIADFEFDKLNAFTKSFVKEQIATERGRKPLHMALENASATCRAVQDLTGKDRKKVDEIASKLDELIAANDAIRDREHALARTEAKMAGIRETPNILAPWAIGLDEEEGRDMQGRSPGEVNAQLAPLDQQTATIKKDLADRKAVYQAVLRDLNSMIETHRSTVKKRLAVIDGDQAKKLASTIRDSYPKQPSLGQAEIIEDIEILIKKHGASSEKLSPFSSNWTETESKLFDVAADLPAKRDAGLIVKLLELLSTPEETKHSTLTGRREGLDGFKNWWCGLSGRLHDAGEAKELDNRFGREILGPLDAQINAATAPANQRTTQRTEAISALKKNLEDLRKALPDDAAVDSLVEDLGQMNDQLGDAVLKLQASGS